MTYTTAVCTVKKSRWWTEELSETCRILFQKQIWEISASSWFYYKNLTWCTVTWTSKVYLAFCVDLRTNRYFFFLYTALTDCFLKPKRICVYCALRTEYRVAQKCIQFLLINISGINLNEMSISGWECNIMFSQRMAQALL